MWIVMCQVSGGVTGLRQGPLRRDGVVQQFATEADAQAEAQRLMAQANGPHRTADFRYWAEEQIMR